MRPLTPNQEPFPHVLRWKLIDRQGQRCEIIGNFHTMTNVQVRFEDGATAIVNRAALRRAPLKKN